MASSSKRPSRKVRESAAFVDHGNDDSIGSNSTLQSRIQEKDELSHLNNRLAGYIEHVRSLEEENKCLKIKVDETEMSRRHDLNDAIGQYENKLEEARERLNELTTQAARGEIAKSKALANEAEAKARVADLEKLLKATETELQDAKKKVQDLTARAVNAENAQKHAEKSNTALTHERDSSLRQIAVLQKQLEDEVVLRTELENRLQTVKEDLDFSRRTHVKQMDEFQRKRQIEMTSYSAEVEDRYKIQLQEQLQDMRNDFDRRIAQSRAETDEMFSSRLVEAEESANQSRTVAQEAREEAARYRFRVTDLETAIAENEQKVGTLNARIKELEQTLRVQQEEHAIRLRQRDDRIASLEADAARLIREYQDLTDVKTQLVTELQAYRTLLEGEETRLSLNASKQSPNVSHVSFSELTSGTRRGTKRKHQDENFIDFGHQGKQLKVENEATGDIVINEVHAEGHFIRLQNNGVEDIPIGGYFLKCTADEKEITFKFHSRQIFKAGKTITIWSNNVGRDPNPPADLVMKNQQWPTGEALRAEFITPDENVAAWQERYTVDTPAAGADEKCCVM